MMKSSGPHLLQKIKILKIFIVGLWSLCSSALWATPFSLLDFYNALINKMVCENYRESFFENYYEEFDPENIQPNFKDLRVPDQDVLATLNGIHELMTTELLKIPTEEGRSLMLHWIRLEMNSQIQPQYLEIHKKLNTHLDRLHGLVLQYSKKFPERFNANCTLSLNNQNDPLLLNNPITSILSAAHKTMATSYQSCQVLDLLPVTQNTESVRGVEKSHSVDGVGWGRKYTDVPLLIQTHYYHRGQSFNDQCMDQSKAPLVYDYGGVPVIKSSSELSMFENSGGGPALGIDCSAYISTALAAGGYLYKPSSKNRPQYTRFVSSDFIDAEKSGWTCFKNIKIKMNGATSKMSMSKNIKEFATPLNTNVETLRSGDIGAVRGHVVMIDEVGPDPFGLENIKTVESCSSLSVKNFDFIILQSSNSKNSLGLNRFVARDYLQESEKMKSLFLAYARAACFTKFDSLERNPKSQDFGIIRHSDQLNCRAPSIKLIGESCVQSCAL